MQGLTLATLADVVEEWKTLPIHAGYQISSLGRVLGPNGLRTPYPNKGGHLGFAIWVNGQNVYVSLHQTVCTLFNGPAPPDKPCALHDNHIPSDCQASNLHWGSDAQNSAEMVEAGRSGFGEKNSQAKLTWDIVKFIRLRRKLGESGSTLAKEYNVTEQTISGIYLNKTWKES